MEMTMRHIALLVVAVCFVVTGRMPTQAQSANLLVNPTFNPPWSKRWDVCKSAVLEEVQVPEGWESYFQCQASTDPQNINRAPEYRMVSDTDFAYRVRSSPTALRYFNFWALNQSAGVFQIVSNITPGSRLRFSMWVQLWTSNSDQLPPTSLIEPGGLETRLCISLDGGRPDFGNPNLICSNWARPYDQYGQLSVEGVAVAGQVTVILNTRAAYPVKHNDVMADDAELVVLGVGDVPVLPTPQPAAPAPEPSVAPAPTGVAPQLAQTQAITDSTIVPPASNTPQIVVIANRRVNIRAKPSLKSILIWQVKKGAVLTVKGISSDRQWWQILYRRRLVWIMALYTLPNEAARNVPVVR